MNSDGSLMVMSANSFLLMVMSANSFLVHAAG